MPTCKNYQLGYFIPSKHHYQIVRNLTNDEINNNERFVAIYKEAEKRLELFHILRLNHEAWTSFTNSLFDPQRDTKDDMLIADQLLLNLMATAYGITEHFNVSFKQRFRKELDKIKEYSALCATSSSKIRSLFDNGDYLERLRAMDHMTLLR